MRAVPLRCSAQQVEAARGAAFLGERGHVFVCWPDGYRTPSYESRSLGPDSVPLQTYHLLAVGLSAEECSAIAALWVSGGGPTPNRARRLDAVRALSPAGARRTAKALRARRRSPPPPGSVSMGYWAGEPCPVVRFPNGRGWYCEDRAPFDVECGAWPWEAEDARICSVLAEGLSLEQCLAAAGCCGLSLGAGRPVERRARVEAYLRERGLL